MFYLQNTATSVIDWNISKKLKDILIEANLVSLDDVLAKKKSELLELDGLGAVSLRELQEYLKFNFKKSLTKEEKKKKLENSDECREIVSHFLGKSVSNWSKELLSAKSLLSKYSKSDLLQVPPPPKIFTLGLLFSEYGIKYIDSHLPKKLMLESTPKMAELSSELASNYSPIEEKYKPKNLKDFLKL